MGQAKRDRAWGRQKACRVGGRGVRAPGAATFLLRPHAASPRRCPRPLPVSPLLGLGSPDPLLLSPNPGSCPGSGCRWVSLLTLTTGPLTVGSSFSQPTPGSSHVSHCLLRPPLLTSLPSMGPGVLPQDPHFQPERSTPSHALGLPPAPLCLSAWPGSLPPRSPARAALSPAHVQPFLLFFMSPVRRTPLSAAFTWPPRFARPPRSPVRRTPVCCCPSLFAITGLLSSQHVPQTSVCLLNCEFVLTVAPSAGSRASCALSGSRNASSSLTSSQVGSRNSRHVPDSHFIAFFPNVQRIPIIQSSVFVHPGGGHIPRSRTWCVASVESPSHMCVQDTRAQDGAGVRGSVLWPGFPLLVKLLRQHRLGRGRHLLRGRKAAPRSALLVFSLHLKPSGGRRKCSSGVPSAVTNGLPLRSINGQAGAG